MANFISLSVTKKGGDSVTAFDQLFDPAKMVDVKLNSAGTAISFLYPSAVNGAEQLVGFESTSVTSISSFQDTVNISASVGRNAIVLVFDPSANADERTVAAHALKDTNGNTFSLPDNSIITFGFYNVVTTFTSAADSATISLGVATDDVAGLKAAVAISDGANPWDAANSAAIIQTGGDATENSVKSTAARSIDATVAVQALTAGKLYLYLEYVTLPS